MFLLINKLAGLTSHRVVDNLRVITGVKKIGHSGTLDPFATGLLIVGIGREATKKLGKFLQLDKAYQAVLKLGAVSDTYDLTGHIKASCRRPLVKQQDIEKVLQGFIGEIDQIPPMFSAKKIKGKKLYELARQGQVVVRQPVRVKVYELRLESYEPKANLLTIFCRVSAGTYVRSLAFDIGERLGVGAYAEQLTRLAIGPFKLSQAVRLEELNPANWRQYLRDIEI